jgi:hypothetical protein
VISPTIEQLRAQADNQINQLIQRELQGAGMRPSNIRATSTDIPLDLRAQVDDLVIGCVGSCRDDDARYGVKTGAAERSLPSCMAGTGSSQGLKVL